ncbi:MAG: hypothetical protein KC549_13740 [Myxococcales bacterium]|nr:hypothetical protein [Myxococcales bacterium]MCB9548716.1 hypothetical protein [Myxococcales bacterium]
MRRLLPVLALAACAENRAPVFDPVPADPVVVVGQTVELVVRAVDRDGDALTYGARGLPQGSVFDRAVDPPVFRWSPLVSDGDPAGREVPVTFIAQDEAGARTEARVVVTVFSGNSEPTFTSPEAAVLDLRVTDTLLLPVTVRDDDSEAVEFSLIEAPAGAELDVTGPKSALVVWEPDPEQLVRQRVFPVTVRAEDERAVPVQLPITVVVYGEAE